MKKLLLIVLSCTLLACNGDKVPDCFQNSGDIIQQEFIVSDFEQITVFPRIELIITDGPVTSVVVETGEFLMNDIEVSIENSRLILKNENGCNLTRDYGITKVFVTAPNITEIRNSSGLAMRSNGVLTYPSLTLISEDFEEEDTFHTDGDFNIQVDSESLEVVTNNLSNIFVSGAVDNLTIGFFSGDGRFEGANLLAQNITIFQRSSNDMILNPQLAISGEIRSTGDVILVNEPPVVNVEAFYTGRLIFQ